MPAHTAAAAPDRQRIADLNARLDRLPTSGLSPMLFAIMGSCYVFTFYDIIAISVTLPTLGTQFHLTGTALALPVTVNLFGYIVGAYVLSSVGDYIGRRRALSISVAVLAVGALLTAFSWNLASLTVFRGLTGIGMGAQISLAATMMTELSPARLRGRGVALNLLCGGVSLAAAPWIGLALVSTLPSTIGWRVVFGIGALAVLALALFNDRWLPESPRWLVLHGHADRAEKILTRMENHVRRNGGDLPAPQPVQAEANLRVFPTAELFRRPYLRRVLVVLFFWFFFYMSLYAYLAYLPTLLKDMGVRDSLLYSAIGDIGFVVGALAAMIFIDRWNRKYSVAVSLFVGAIGVALIALAGHNPALIIIGIFLTSTWSNTGALGYTYTTEIFPTRARASAMAIGDGLGHLGAAVQPYIVVASLAAFGSRGTFGLIAAIILIAATVMLTGGIKTAGTNLTDLAH
jgi:MFS transporter, putative metabolite:H+ symporter